MDPFIPSIWNVFHDGCVDSVSSLEPGVVVVEVSIEYIRERIKEPGETFTVTFGNCTRFVYRNYDDEEFSSDFAKIADANPGILSADMKGEICVVHGDCGAFEVVATDGSIAINGKPFMLTELFQVATDYWEEWEARSQVDKK